MNSRFFRGPLSCWGVDALFDVLVGLVLVGLVVGLVADVRTPDSRPEHPPGLRGDRDEFAVSHPEDGSLLGMVSTSPLRSSGGKGGAMGAGHDADVDAVAVADRDDDAIDAFETSGSNVLPAFGPARTRVFLFCGPLSWGVDALLVVLVVLVLIIGQSE